MILRAIVLAAGLIGALSAAQFPAYSQQYVQRLGGAVHALDKVVADFDASAAALGLSRQEALSQLQGTAFAEARRADMQTTFARHAALSADLAALQATGPLVRAYRIRHMTDPVLARGAWASFEPAFPLTLASALFACVGFVAGGVMIGAVLRLGRRLLLLPA